VDLEFDFRLHADRSLLTGTQYFELAPGASSGRPWAQRSRYIDEYTFSLIEGIFEKHARGYDHFAFVEVPRSQWEPILSDVAALRVALSQAGETHRVTLPYGSTLNVQVPFERSLASNQRALAGLLADLETWLSQTCAENEVVSVLGL
jgi:hypothetical protein